VALVGASIALSGIANAGNKASSEVTIKGDDEVSGTVKSSNPARCADD
jgi:hypothetical protein